MRILAAAVTTGLLVFAIAALDAVGADRTKADESAVTQIVACLRDRGVAVPNLHGTELDRWLQRNVPDADGRACKRALAGVMEPTDKRAAGSEGVDKIMRCLRAKGFDPPTDPVALKQWIGVHPDAAQACAPAPAAGCGEKEKPRGT